MYLPNHTANVRLRKMFTAFDPGLDLREHYRRATGALHEPKSDFPQNGVTEMVRRLNFTGSVEDLVGRFKEDHRHADSIGRH